MSATFTSAKPSVMDRVSQEPSSATQSRDSVAFPRPTLACPDPIGRTGTLPTFCDSSEAESTEAQKSMAFESLRRKRDAELKSAAETVRSLLIRLGLTGMTDLVINFDPWGDVVVSGNLPTLDRVRLGKILSTHAGFRAAFAAAAHTAGLVAAGEVLVPFARAYEKDASQAVAHYAWLFDSGWAFSLIYAKGEATFRVNSGL